ncbi:uncharacterized protein LOC130495557 [Raphanus sativus]|uniref:Uncharacterized protein LOC130495557 n=1 Tax=Raphanus sativus TaxID=3726 RepID=A0A9W3BUI0_RAPSA|nr:uncharacterized protein LOC130495557 [Raphanus sativus]
MLFRGNEYEISETVEKAWEDIEEWQCREEAKVEVVKKTTTEKPDRKWLPPAPTWLKCNTDGSWEKETDQGGAGWITRDHTGSLLWAGAKKMVGMGSALDSEAEALKWAICTMNGFRYKRVIFETDSLVLQKMIRGEEEVWPRMRPIIQDIQSVLSRQSEYVVEYYPRSGNKVADRIAKETAAFTSIVPKLYSIVPVWLNPCMEAEKLL